MESVLALEVGAAANKIFNNAIWNKTDEKKIHKIC